MSDQWTDEMQELWEERLSRIIDLGGTAFEVEANSLYEMPAAMRLAVAEIRRLREIVERLPKTADGVPIIRGNKYYYVDPTGYVQSLDYGAVYFRTDSSIPDIVYSSGERTYSTREAAEAAKGEK
ncbi:MAG: hypothetical protein WC485_00345 [Opitutaceae bacterium]